MPSGAIPIVTPTGNEAVIVDNGGAVLTTMTTSQIAGLSGNGLTQDILSTPITTVGNGTLTAAAMLGGLIIRTGPVAAYTDTTDTAAAIVSAIGSFNSGATFVLTIKNATPYVQTLAGGTGVTLPATVLVGPFQEGEYYGTIGGTSASPTIALSHLLTTAISLAPSISNPSSVILSTVGAGTILASAFTAGGTARTGSQSGTPFTDTTDTAAAIIAANPGLVGKIGSSLRYEYTNLTNAIATITGTSGVTVSQPAGSLATTAIVPPGYSAAFNLTYTAAATITMVGIALTPSSTVNVPSTQRTSGSVTVNGSAAYVNVTGLSFQVIPGTYRFDCYLPSTVASGTGGIKYAFNYTTTVLSSIQATGYGFTASAVAVQQTTTATTQADIFTQAAVVILTRIMGTMVVTTGGTVDVQVAQNTSNGSNTIALVGGSATFTRIA